NLEFDGAVALLDQGRSMVRCQARDFAELDCFARRQESLGFNPGQAHQILDNAEHAPSFAVNDRTETSARLFIDFAFVRERLGIARDGGEGSSQFMAGIGYEV